jgi:outer membrane protein assembly factor BamB
MRRISPLIVLLGALFGVLAPSSLAGAQSATSSSGCDAVAQHEDASHSGSSCTTLVSSPPELWTLALNGSSSYPLIADGMVFVTTSDQGGSYGGWLYAIDQATGKIAWGPVPLSGTYYSFTLAYDNGTVFVNNFNGTITAFEASTGSQLWAQNTSDFSGNLVASNGVVYVQGSGPVYAVSETTGAILWVSPDLDGDGSSLSVDATGVYVAAGCSWFGLSLTTGAKLWSGNDGCDGGGGGTTYLDDGRVFADANFGSPLVLNESTGATVGTYSGTPAFSGSNGYFVNGDTLFAENVSTLTPVFTVTLPASATTSPVIAGNIVYVGAGSNVYGISDSTGAVVWTGALPGPAGGGAQYSSSISDINVGDGLLVVPVGDTLIAFGGQVATHTTASPAIVKVSGFATKSAVLSATLTSAVTGSGVSGQTMTFKLESGSTARTCSAQTNAKGVASCTVNLGLLAKVASSYTASFAGSAAYLPSSGTSSVKQEL